MAPSKLHSSQATFKGNGKMRGARREEGIVRVSVLGIHAMNGVISEAACKAAVGLLYAVGEGRE